MVVIGRFVQNLAGCRIVICHLFGTTFSSTSAYTASFQWPRCGTLIAS